MGTYWVPSNVPSWFSDLILGSRSLPYHPLSRVWLQQDSLKERRVCSTFLYCFDREAQLLFARSLTHTISSESCGRFHGLLPI